MPSDSPEKAVERYKLSVIQAERINSLSGLHMRKHEISGAKLFRKQELTKVQEDIHAGAM